MKKGSLSLLLAVAVSYHDEVSPAVGHFPGRRRLLANHEERRLQVAPLYGSINDYAYYFVDVLVGTPPKRQSVIMDSGSSLLGFPCTGCRHNCGRHLDNPFDISSSSTAELYSCMDSRCVSNNGCESTENDTCLYSQVYSEGSSIDGFFFSDVIAMGEPESMNSFVRYDYIGCHTKETVLFTTQQASGILGVSFPKGGRQPTVMDVLMGSSIVNSKVFSICAAEEGGLLTVGGYNATYHVGSPSTPANPSSLGWISHLLRGSAGQRSRSGGLNRDVVWAKIISDSSYSIEVSRLLLNGQPIASGGFGDVLVDSGTTYTYFPNDVYNRVAAALLHLCNKNNQLPLNEQAGTCVKGTADLICFNFKGRVSEELRKVPSFALELSGGGVIHWGAESWLFRKSAKVWCSAVENNRRPQTILGMSFMKNKEVIFDRDNSNIGFVSANCPSHDVKYRRKEVLGNDI